MTTPDPNAQAPDPNSPPPPPAPPTPPPPPATPAPQAQPPVGSGSHIHPDVMLSLGSQAQALMELGERVATLENAPQAQAAADVADLVERIGELEVLLRRISAALYAAFTVGGESGGNGDDSLSA